MSWVLVGVVLAVLALLFAKESHASPKRLKDITVFWIFLGMAIPLIEMVVENLYRKPGFDALAAFGGIVFLLGAVVRFTARRNLGKYFTYEVASIRKHRLVKSGMYRYVRHPLYIGILLLWLGAAITLQSFAGFIFILLILVPALWHRMHVEEAFLVRKFGENYQKYMGVTKRLVPFVY